MGSLVGLLTNIKWRNQMETSFWPWSKEVEAQPFPYVESSSWEMGKCEDPQLSLGKICFRNTFNRLSPGAMLLVQYAYQGPMYTAHLFLPRHLITESTQWEVSETENRHSGVNTLLPKTWEMLMSKMQKKTVQRMSEERSFAEFNFIQQVLLSQWMRLT